MSKPGGAPSTKWFALITISYLLAVVAGAWALGYFDSSGRLISPSEWGDVLAGVFSPLAFLWLLYASLSQRAELQLQREELRQNNITQGDQRDEMRRQVEAMTAQAKLLEAQAAATFDPVFVVKEMHAARDGYRVDIVNRGCEVLNVFLRGDFTLRYLNGSTSGFDDTDREVYYWATGSHAEFQMGEVDPAALHEVSIQYTRKDGATKRNIYVVSIPKQSLRLVQSDQVMPAAGHR